jgi:hypothetical protein
MKINRLVSIFSKLLTVFAVIIGLALVGCNGGVSTSVPMRGAQTAYTGPVDVLAIASEELPTGWNFDRAVMTDLHGVEAKKFYFYNTAARDLLWVNIGQTIAIYPDESQATAAYPEWVSENFPSIAWQPAVDLEFQNHADQLQVRCFPAKINEVSTLTCGQLARYKNIIVRILGNTFEGRWLTKPDFLSVLKAIDKRVTDTLRQSK